MSRIGKAPINIPKEVNFAVDNNVITIKGGKGTLKYVLSTKIKISQDSGKIILSRETDDKETRSLHGLSRSIISNMVIGVSKGFEKDLELTGVGYRAAKEGKKLILSMGFSHPVEVIPPEGIDFIVSGQNKIKVAGPDKHIVGQVAANIKYVRPIEPYKAKGIKYAGQYVRRKAGKAAAKAA